MKKFFESNSKKLIVFSIFGVVLLIIVSTYAMNSEKFITNIGGIMIGIDEEAYGENNFNSSNLDFRPILDGNVINNSENVIHIDFLVGGSKYNATDELIYDIALVDLEVDCSLLSPYLKWSLFKNDEKISEGSLDYKFDTIKDGRLVLTGIQQDLKKYNKDKSSYDKFDFYMWLSDSCQSDDLFDCIGMEDQSHLMGKRIKGKIEVELYGGKKKELVRKSSDILNTDYCVVGSGDEIYVNG